MIADSTVILTYNKIRGYLGYDNLQYSAVNVNDKWKIKLLSEGEFIKIKDYEITEGLKTLIKRNYVINWCLGIPLRRNDDFSIFMEKDDPLLKIIFRKKVNIDFSIIDIPATIMNKWFDSNWDNFVNIFSDIWNHDTMPNHHKNILKIIKKYSPEQIWWHGNIISRIDYLIKA